MKSIELRTRAQGLGILTEELLGSRSGVHHDDGNIAKLYLIDWSVLFGPYPILFGSVLSNLRQVANKGQTSRATESGDASGRPHEFIDHDIGCRNQNGNARERLIWMLLGGVVDEGDKVRDRHFDGLAVNSPMSLDRFAS